MDVGALESAKVAYHNGRPVIVLDVLGVEPEGDEDDGRVARVFGSGTNSIQEVPLGELRDSEAPAERFGMEPREHPLLDADEAVTAVERPYEPRQRSSAAPVNPPADAIVTEPEPLGPRHPGAAPANAPAASDRPTAETAGIPESSESVESVTLSRAEYEALRAGTWSERSTAPEPAQTDFEGPRIATETEGPSEPAHPAREGSSLADEAQRSSLETPAHRPEFGADERD